MAHHSPARWLAPSALVAAALTLVVVLATSTGSEQESASSSPPAEETTTTQRRPETTPARTSTREAGTPETYTVQSGDILSTIAEKTGVPVERLRELNPDLDANSMTVGQELRLEPESP
jgi:LysM repeat protein